MVLYETKALRLSLIILALFALADPIAAAADCIASRYCSPTFNETWEVGSTYTLSWNRNYGTLPMKPKVDIYLYDMSDTRLPFKDWLAYDNSGTLTITVTPDYFPNVPTGISGPNLIRWFRFNVVSQGDVAESSSAGPIFRIHDSITSPSPTAGAGTAIVTTLVVTVSSTLTMVSSSGTYVPLANFDSSNGVSGRTIGIIVGSILGALAVGILAFFLIRRRNRTNQLVTGNEKVVNRSPNILNPGTMGTATSGQTANSANPLVSARGFPNQSTTSLSGSAPRGFDGQTSGLTENEAKLIAETYRKSLRKPGWDDEEPHGQSTSSSGLL